jgi:hypothetical protein
MQFLLSVIVDKTELASPGEAAAIDGPLFDTKVALRPMHGG